MGRSYLARVLIWFVALAGLGLQAFAQQNTGNVYGNVIDQTGTPIPGGTATLTGPSQPTTTSVDATGLFRFLKVPPGRYSVTVTMPGFTTVTRENVIVSVGQNTQIDMQLKLSSVQETVTVTSETPLLDPRKVETGQNFSRDELTEIPTSRDIWSLIQQVPGVQIDTVNVAGNQSAIAGGPDFITKGSGNVVYQVDGATSTDNTYGNPFARQNGGTNTFFDFSTIQDVEVATGGSVLEQQTSGVTINVVTKRGTNEFHGAARYLYASSNWQSDNTPQEAVDQGLPNEQHADDPRVRRGLRRPDRQGQAVAVVRRRLPDHQHEPDRVQYDLRHLRLAHLGQPRALEREAERADLQRQLGAALLPAQRPDAVSTRPSGRRARPRPRPCSRSRPTSTRSRTRTSSPRISSPRSSRPTRAPTTPTSATAPRTAHRPTSPSPARGGHDRGTPGSTRARSTTTIVTTTPRTRRGRPTSRSSKFFNTGSVNHEVKFSFNYRQQIADSATGWPGDQNVRQRVRVLVVEYGAALPRRAAGLQEPVSGAERSATRSRWATSRSQLGVRYDRQQAKNLPGSAFENVMFPDLLPAIQYHGSPTTGSSTSRTGSRASRRPTPSGEKKDDAAAGLVRAVRRPARVHRLLRERRADIERLLLLLDRHQQATTSSSRTRSTSSTGFYGFYNDIDPATLPNVPNIIQPNLKIPKTNEFTFGVDQQFTDNFAVSATFSYRNTNNLIQYVADRRDGLGDVGARGANPVRGRQRQPGALHGHRGQRLHAPVRRAVLQPARFPRSPSASRSPTVPGRRRSTTGSTSRSSNDCRTTGCSGATSAGTASSST